MPVVEPRPRPRKESRLGAPEEAQDASYFAASARIASLAGIDGIGAPSSVRQLFYSRTRSSGMLARAMSPACIRLPQAERRGRLLPSDWPTETVQSHNVSIG